VLKVAGFAERRGDATLAATLYEDLSPPMAARPAGPAQAVREAGTGRPTKAERRAWSRLVDDDG
jgi:ribosome-associated heat shock protein Hsp15